MDKDFRKGKDETTIHDLFGETMAGDSFVRDSEPESVEELELETVSGDAEEDEYIVTPVTENSEAEEDAEDAEIKRLIRILAIAGSAVLLLVLLIVIILFMIMTRRNQPDSESSSVAESEESKSYYSDELLGVVLDVKGDEVVIYDAAQGETQTFDISSAKRITDQYGEAMDAKNIMRGQLVQVEYNGADNSIEMFRLTAQGAELTNVSGLKIGDGTITVGEKTLTFDENLLCIYRGQDMDPTQITENMVVKISFIGDHVYTLQVLKDVGTIRVQDVPLEYLGMQLKLIPEVGQEVKMVLSNETVEQKLPEGYVDYVVLDETTEKDRGRLLLGGQGTVYVLTFDSEMSQIGIVEFDVNVTTAQIQIGEDVYYTGDEISLPYGEYTAQVLVGGQDSIEVKFVISQPYMIQKVDINDTTTKVIMSSSMSGSKLYIDGEYKATFQGSPLTYELETGVYELRVKNEGYEDKVYAIEVAANMADKVVYFTQFIPLEEDSQDSESASNEESDVESEGVME